MTIMPHASRGGRVLVIGSGVAGLAAALSLAPLPVTLVTAGRLAGDSATAWAQGGIAAALGPDDDPALHAADTLAAGAGLSDPERARELAAAAPDAIRALIDWGVRFDRDAAGRLAFGLEGAHSRRRILHADGDQTGAAIAAALTGAARRTRSIEVLEGVRVTSLLGADGAVTGVRGLRGGRPILLPAPATVLATGGVGGLYAATTNPPGAVGAGIALAARAGAVLRDLELVQFHPTAIALDRDPMPLASEAIRGEGAVLVNDRGEPIMAGVPGRDLAPRDVVARAIFEQLAAGRPVFLDARAALGERFATRFPSIAGVCRAAGLDPARAPIPVRPAAHYHMGGVRVDGHGRTSVERLWACGEVAASGLHGANRLASNSLVEGVTQARRVAEDVAGAALPDTARRPLGVPLGPARPAAAARAEADVAALRRLMEREVGVVRDAGGLERAVLGLIGPAAGAGAAADRALVGLLIALSAHRRAESRGAQCRRDHPAPDPAWQRHSDLTLAEALAEAAWIEDTITQTGLAA